MENCELSTITINGIEYVKKEDAQVKTKTHIDDDGLEYAIIRSREQGVMCGFVSYVEGRTVALKRARQIWKYSSRFVLADLAEHGLTSKYESKLSCEMSQKMVMLEACGILYCTKKAAKSLIEKEPENNEV